MATWKNLDTLASYSKLAELKGHVNIADAMAGEKGAERVKKYSTPMAAGLTYNYAAKQVDETVLDALAKLADEAELLTNSRNYNNGACDQHRRETYGSSSPCTYTAWRACCC